MTSPIPPRRPGRRAATTTAAALFAVLATLTGPAGPATADTTRAAPASAAPAAGTQHTVTLLTGDVVQVSDPGKGHRTVDITRSHGATGGVRTDTARLDRRPRGPGLRRPRLLRLVAGRAAP